MDSSVTKHSRLTESWADLPAEFSGIRLNERGTKERHAFQGIGQGWGWVSSVSCASSQVRTDTFQSKRDGVEGTCANTRLPIFAISIFKIVPKSDFPKFWKFGLRGGHSLEGNQPLDVVYRADIVPVLCGVPGGSVHLALVASTHPLLPAQNGLALFLPTRCLFQY